MAKKIPCPQCDQKFKTETGRDWHLEHIHDQLEHSSILNSQKTTESTATDKVTAKNVGQASLQQDSLELKRHVNDIEEIAKCRLDIGLKRDAWLSERIARLEENCLNLHKIESR